MLDLFFYALCAVMLGLALVTVLARNLFRAALGLLGLLLGTAVLFLLLRAEMVALVQIMVYIGGIMIFVLYAVLLTSELGGKMARPSLLKIISALIVAGAVFGSIFKLIRATHEYTNTITSGDRSNFGNIADIISLGLRLLDPGPDGFLIPFELISVVLLAAMVGAIALARRENSK